jgi:cytochrome P450
MDVELAGHLIKKGDTITLLPQSPRRFYDPDTRHLRRRAVGHVSFGHGIHQCIGRQPARVELRIAYRELLTRFPALRPATAAEEVAMVTSIVHSVPKLMVARDA